MYKLLAYIKNITSNLSSGRTAFVARSYTDIACLAKPCSSSNFAYSKYKAAIRILIIFFLYNIDVRESIKEIIYLWHILVDNVLNIVQTDPWYVLILYHHIGSKIL